MNNSNASESTTPAPAPAPTPTPTPTPAPTPSESETVTQDNNKSDFAEQVVDLVNQERSKAGLNPLKSDAALTNVAMIKAKDMYNNNYFDHNSPTLGSPFDLMKSEGVQYRTAGENIAKGQRTPEEVMNAWMNSEGHRQNILNPNFTSIGVAYYNGEWVQEFTG
ncbi:Cysteine-rich secretory protein family protein [compost metagenome]